MSEKPNCSRALAALGLAATLLLTLLLALPAEPAQAQSIQPPYPIEAEPASPADLPGLGGPPETIQRHWTLLRPTIITYTIQPGDNDYAIALGHADAAKVIQDLYLGGRKDDAARAVPDALVDAVALVGPKDRIRERLARWRAAGARRQVTSMLIGTFQKEAMELLAQEIL